MSSEQVDDLSKKMGQPVHAIMTKPRAAPGHFVTSIVVSPVPTSDFNPETICAEVADLTAKIVGAKAEAPKLVEFPFGKTCQFEMGDEKQQAIQTVVYLETKFWTVTCNFDRRDTSSPKECDEVLKSVSAK